MNLSVFKPDENVRYRAEGADQHLGNNNIIMLYLKEDGQFLTYETDFNRLAYAKAVGSKLRE